MDLLPSLVYLIQQRRRYLCPIFFSHPITHHLSLVVYPLFVLPLFWPINAFALVSLVALMTFARLCISLLQAGFFCSSTRRLIHRLCHQSVVGGLVCGLIGPRRLGAFIKDKFPSRPESRHGDLENYVDTSWGIFTYVGTGTNGRVCTSPGKMLLILSAAFGRTLCRNGYVWSLLSKIFILQRGETLTLCTEKERKTRRPHDLSELRGNLHTDFRQRSL